MRWIALAAAALLALVIGLFAIVRTSAQERPIAGAGHGRLAPPLAPELAEPPATHEAGGTPHLDDMAVAAVGELAEAACAHDDFATAHQLADRVLASEPSDQRALAVAVRAACGENDAIAARTYAARLAPDRQELVASECLRDGVAIP